MSETLRLDELCCAHAEGKLCPRHEKSVLPQLAEPGWYRLVPSGEMTPSEESPTNVRSRQRYQRSEKARRLSRLALGTTGAFTGRNRQRQRNAA